MASSLCLYFAGDGRDWGKYLFKLLQTKALQLDVSRFGVDSSRTKNPRDKNFTVKLLLVSPDFLDYCKEPVPPWFPTDDSCSVIALLCSVEPSDFTAARKYRNWTILYLETSDSSIEKLITDIVKVVDDCEESALDKSVEPKPAPRKEPPAPRKRPVHIPVPVSDPNPTAAPEPTPTPTPAPAPRTVVRKSQSVPIGSEPRTPSVREQGVLIPEKSTLRINWVIPRKFAVPGEEVAIIFFDTMKSDDVMEVEIRGERLATRRINAHTIVFDAPLNMRGKAQVEIYQGGIKRNSYPLNFEPLDMTGLSYISLLVRVLGVSLDDREVLDTRLLEMFNQSVPADSSAQLAFSHIMGRGGDITERSSEQLPTLLHFAAANGLNELCCRVLELPGGLAAYQMENCNGSDPGRLAEDAGHADLAEYLRNFMETKIAVDMVDDIYMEMNGHSLLYENTKPYSQQNIDTYSSVPMSPFSASLYSAVHYGSGPDSDSDDGMQGRPTAIVPERLSKKRLAQKGRRRNSDKSHESKVPPKPPPKKASTLPAGLCIGPETPTAGTCGSSSQEELKQIQTLCAEGELSVEDAQRLFDAWRMRFCGPTQSFKERQAALDSLRQTFRITLEQAEQKKNKSSLGRALTRLRTTRQKNRRAQDIDENDYTTMPVSSPLPPDSDAQRASNSSGYSSGDLRDSRGWNTEEYQGYSEPPGTRRTKKAFHVSRRMSVRMMALKEPGALELGKAPPVPQRSHQRSRRPLPDPY